MGKCQQNPPGRKITRRGCTCICCFISFFEWSVMLELRYASHLTYTNMQTQTLYVHSHTLIHTHLHNTRLKFVGFPGRGRRVGIPKSFCCCLLLRVILLRWLLFCFILVNYLYLCDRHVCTLAGQQIAFGQRRLYIP